MSTKTIGIRKEVYERLASENREGESFSDTIERLVDEAQPDWRAFGKLKEDGEEFERVVEEQREDLSESVAERQDERMDEAS